MTAIRRAGLFSAMTEALTAALSGAPVSGTKKTPCFESFASNFKRLPVSCIMPPLVSTSFTLPDTMSVTSVM